MKEKNNMKNIFFLYLPNQKTQGRGTANKQFLRIASLVFYM